MKPEQWLILVLLGGALLMMFSGTRRRQRQTQQMNIGLVAGAQVMTTAGLYATVVEVDGAIVVLETAPGQTSRWDRRAISRVLPTQEADGRQDGGQEAGGQQDGGTSAAGDPADRDRADSDETDTDGGGVVGADPSSQQAAPPDRA